MTPATLEAAHQSHHRLVWNVCYRMTGSRADADELVQETWLRALETAPTVSDAQPLAPWLVAVATRLALDRLRARQARPYVGPWIPEPVPSSSLTDVEAPPSAEYELLESASLAFLLALEVLSPEQRAVVVLRDVFDWSVAEVANALGATPENVRQLHHRARTALKPYRDGRPGPELRGHAGTRALLERFFVALTTGDADAARALLEDDATALTDGGGRYFAAQVPLAGAERVLLFFQRLLELRGSPSRVALVELNGAVVIDADFPQQHPNEAPRSLTGVVAGPSGKIRLVYSVLAPEKLPPLTPAG